MISELRTEVLQALEALQVALKALSSAILSESNRPAWVSEVPFPYHSAHSRAARERAISVLTQLTYQPEQAPRSILLCPGFIGASEETLALVEAVNTAKSRFKAAMLALKAVRGGTRDPLLAKALDHRFARHREASTRDALQRMGLSQLHLKQCYRLLPVVPTPVKIRWTWANTRAIKRISVDTAKQRLARRADDPSIQWQLERLNALSPSEPLAVVQELAPHLRTNLVVPTSEREDGRMMLKGAVPLFFPLAPGDEIPDFKPPTEKKGRAEGRPTRSDVKLDPEVYIPALRAHRYRDPKSVQLQGQAEEENKA